MNIEFKKYCKIGMSRLLNIKVILNDDELIYEGEVDEAPKDIKERYYYRVQLVGNRDAIYFVYDDDVAQKIIDENKNE